MNYYEVVFSVDLEESFYQDIIINDLGQLGFETFEQTENGFNAYINAEIFQSEILNNYIANINYGQLKFSVNFIPYTNWNEVWESNFNPIIIKDKIYIRAIFHPAQTNFMYELIIHPKMAFGTGHHQTTTMMMEYMLEIDFNNKVVLDMGSGTGILAILASKLGARELIAIDNDKVCFESVNENAKLNDVTNIVSVCGSKEAIPDKKFDIILANINRNILLDHMDDYVNHLNKNGLILFSGFHLDPDLKLLIDAAQAYDLKFLNHTQLDEWVAAKFVI